MTEPVPYKIGDSDKRAWGEYVVTGVGTNAKGEEFCAKDITVKPGAILSLQSHDQRRELWTVKSGTLTVVLDEQRLDFKAGQSVNIPLKAIHCMANLTDKPVVVNEIQEGVCREADIRRFSDANGRPVETPSTPQELAGLKHYKDIVAEIGRMGQKRQPSPQL